MNEFLIGLAIGFLGMLGQSAINNYYWNKAFKKINDALVSGDEQ